MATRSCVRLAAAALLATAPLLAQFSSVTATPVAPGCNLGWSGCCAVPSAPATLEFTLDTNAQRLDVTVAALEGCCGVTVPLRVLALGTTSAAVPLPQFGVGCTLHVTPAVLLASVVPTFSLQLPASPATLGFLAQGLAWQTWSIAPVAADRFLFTAASAVSLQ